ncbi:hypothetical protein DdX_09980 [Ditylenchus destructor]|uniref:Uncharacterized protein n=1 Tax=Ditylenchus destructor TaxID=166010 RepID=A0AAD4N328_9BILA|nr:hypothetical protein DdX_09980 [Ditylenchus destructor]
MTDRRVDFTETESEDSSNEENVEPAENSHASSGLEGSFQLVPRRSENEQAEHDLVQDVSQERGRKVGSKNDEYDIAEEFENLSDFKQWFADKQDNWTRTSRNTKKCDQDYYRCRFARTKGFNCKAKLKVIFDAKSEAVTVWKTSAEHTHVPNLEIISALSEEIKVKIRSLMELSKPPQEIDRELRKIPKTLAEFLFVSVCQKWRFSECPIVNFDSKFRKTRTPVKYEKEEFRWPEEFAALPLNTKFTGRPRKRQLVTRYQGN